MNQQDFKHYYGSLFPCSEETLTRQAGNMNTPLVTPEFHESNDYYGAAFCLKQYAGLSSDYALKVSMEHGITLGTIWNIDIDVPLPGLFFVGRHRYFYLKSFTNKLLYAIGPALAYTKSTISPSLLMDIKKNLGKTLLVFPTHSTHWIDSNYDIKNYCLHLDAYKYIFDTIIILMYWKDIILEKHITYLKNGFICLSAGHMYNKNFLPNIKNIILLADSTCCTRFTTGSAYCLLLNKPHFYDPIIYHDINKLKNDKTIKKDATHITESFARIFDKNKSTIFSITDAQRAFGRDYMGLEDVKTPEEMRAILGLLEELMPYYQDRLYSPNFPLEAARFLKKQGKPLLAAMVLQQLETMNNLADNGR